MPPRLARLLAVLFAVALVVVAFVVRGALSDDETSGAEPADPQEREESEFQLVCDADLGDAVCDAAADLLGVESLEVLSLAGVLAAATEPQASEWDLRLTLDPMPGVLDTARRQAGLQPLSGPDVVALGSSPLALLVPGSGPLGDCQPSPVSWSCLLMSSERIALPSPMTSVGSVGTSAGAVALTGGTDFGIGAFQGTDEGDTLARFVDRSPTAAGNTVRDQATAMLQPGNAAAAVTIAGIGETIANTNQGRTRNLAVRPLTPEVTVGVVLVGLGTQGQDAMAQARDAVDGDGMRDALTQDGWAGDASASAGLPAADVVYALREELG